MNLRLLVSLTFVTSALASVLAYPRLPARVPLHWNLAGEADRYGSPLELLLVGPGLVLFVGALTLAVERIDPRLRGGEDDPTPRRFVMGLATLLVGALHVLVLATALGALADPTRGLVLALGGFFTLAGNVMTRVRPNWFAGVRTPWTLSSDHVWRKTHRLAGHLMFASGLLIVVGGLALPRATALAATLALLLANGAAAIAYSYWVWRGERAH